jgi:hypothetical protein
MHHILTRNEAILFFDEINIPADLLIQDLSNNTKQSYLARLEIVNQNMRK